MPGRRWSSGLARRRGRSNRATCRLHKLANDIVDGSDMIGVESVPDPEHIGERRDAEQSRTIAEGEPGPDPGRAVGGSEPGIGDRKLGFELCLSIVEWIGNHAVPYPALSQSSTMAHGDAGVRASPPRRRGKPARRQALRAFDFARPARLTAGSGLSIAQRRPRPARRGRPSQAWVSTAPPPAVSFRIGLPCPLRNFELLARAGYRA